MYLSIVVEMVPLSQTNSSGKNNWKIRRKSACCDSFWKRKFENIDIDSKVYLMAVTVTKEIRLQVLQWKIIHNIYPTQILLFKMGKSANSNCKYCNERDFLEHFFCTCSAVKPIWAPVENRMSVIMETEITTSISQKLFGIFPQISINRVWK